MNLKCLLISILSLIFIVSLLSINSNSSYKGQIRKITYNKNIIYISLKNHDTEFILFTNELLNITQNDVVTIFGTEEIYKNQRQIVVNKMIK